MFALAVRLPQPLAAAAVEAVAIAMASMVRLTVAFMVPSLSSDGASVGGCHGRSCTTRPSTLAVSLPLPAI
ncbi:hypothetical protein G6F31_021903 [Rhizopus arrhizus]|nr:hypothetical protein G6F31_021903 [Rhizopus arrhizus]